MNKQKDKPEPMENGELQPYYDFDYSKAKPNRFATRLASLASNKKKRIAGLNRGMIWTSDDFDAPLPDEFWLGNA